MSVNSISGDVAPFKLQSLTAALDKPAKETPATNHHSSLSQAVQSSAIDSIGNNRDSPANKSSTDAGSETHKQPTREMSYVVETYNQQGKLRIKFMDSNNNLLYQIPSEMVAKMEDQMMKPETSTNIKG